MDTRHCETRRHGIDIGLPTLIKYQAGSNDSSLAAPDLRKTSEEPAIETSGHMGFTFA